MTFIDTYTCVDRKSIHFSPAVNTGLNAALKIYYFDSEQNGQTSDGDMALWRSADAGTTWSWRGGTFVENGSLDNVTVKYIDAFSKWTVSNVVEQPLPIELRYFEAATNEEGEVVFDWETATIILL